MASHFAGFDGAWYGYCEKGVTGGLDMGSEPSAVGSEPPVSHPMAKVGRQGQQTRAGGVIIEGHTPNFKLDCAGVGSGARMCDHPPRSCLGCEDLCSLSTVFLPHGRTFLKWPHPCPIVC